MWWAYAYMSILKRPPIEFLKMPPGEKILTAAYLSMYSEVNK